MDNMEFPTRARAVKDKSQRKIFDWTREPRPDHITPFQKFILDVDWEKSPLGPIKQWPIQLRQMVLLIVQDPSPAVVYWGDDATIVYNEAYIQLIGQKHPALQGQDPKIEFAEIWDHFEKLLVRQREDAQTTVEANAYLLLFRHGFFEETYFSWKFVPIIGEGGWVVGSHATVVEVTREVIRDRRMGMVRHLSRQLSGATTIKDLWSKIIRGIEDADKDIPLSLLYSIDDPLIGSRASSKSSVRSTPKSRASSEENSRVVVCLLEGSIGIPPGHPVAATSLASDNEESWLVPLIRQAMKERSPVEASLDEKVLKMLDGLEWRGHGVASTQVVVCPIIPTDSNSLLALLVVFLNPRRPYDEDYRNWLHLLTQQVTTPQLSAVILREEVERRQALASLAALDRERLFRELTESETKFARFATRAPIGLAILAPDGTALSANDLWRDLTQLEIGTNRVNWEEVLTEDQVVPVQVAWDTILKERRSLSIQTRIRRPWQAPDLDVNGNSQWADTEILLALHPDFDEHGEVYTVMSCITDVSGLKWSESQLRRRMDQAIEMKKQQERFIDMTSHEMRNPLSALIGCADEIIASLKEFRHDIILSSDPSTTSLPSSSPVESLHLITEAIEAADTIIYCAMHQKRIIDDILTLSRLDSNLLLVSPEPSQPITLIRSALKMFDAELKRASTSLSIIEEPSIKSLNVSWTLLDPSRVLQVLINLMTNAIKFTRTEPLRKITITMGASLTKPSEKNTFNVQFVRKSNGALDQTSKSEWGNGDVIYLCITVEDTGRGLNSNEIKNLFHLFAQASPKTYQTYGGSGLGLFICRQLVEMQGGEIGVKSEAGKGSVFQFYVKTRRTSPPPSLLSKKEIQNGHGNGNEIESREGQEKLVTGTETKEFHLLVREDALREACAVEISTLQTPNLDRSFSPGLNVEEEKRSFHILVVEDNLVNQKVVSKQLRKAGHVVSVANHGEEALTFLRGSKLWIPDPNPDSIATTSNAAPITTPTNSAQNNETQEKHSLDVILMDLEMPVMDGISCVKNIRNFQEKGMIKSHVPVIAVTANARKDQILRSLEAGMDDVTTKPYRINDMLKQIEGLLAKHK